MDGQRPLGMMSVQVRSDDLGVTRSVLVDNVIVQIGNSFLIRKDQESGLTVQMFNRSVIVEVLLESFSSLHPMCASPTHMRVLFKHVGIQYRGSTPVQLNQNPPFMKIHQLIG